MDDMLDRLGEQLAQNRNAGVVGGLALSAIADEAEALAVQQTALDAYDSDFKGYALVGTSHATRRTLGLREPIYAPIPRKAFHDKLAAYTLPAGMIGAQCELALTLGRTFPDPGETIGIESCADAVVACQPAIGLLGRRTRPIGDAHLAAIADFGLHVATICGASTRHLDPLATARLSVRATIDGNTVAKADLTGADEHPLLALAWLARQLRMQHAALSAGDIVTLGSFTPILQVLPDQELAVAFAGLGTVSCAFR
ncbi:fumarylacetoacetate hydrolase [Mesorhizobium sp. CC13]|uniref:2-keto-4-pentenoate hydratase n=1 Tax=Mesorhizobium sp. CC13 TaxID=3029194 RepID=UPI003263341B